MACFSEAIKAAKDGHYIRCPSGLNKWIHYDHQVKLLVHSTPDFDWLSWVPNQRELLANDWEIM